LAPKQLFAASGPSSLAKTPAGTPKALDFIAKVPSPFDSTPRNVYRFDGAAIHRPMAGLTRFADEKKIFKAFEKNDQQHFIRGCLESQHHLLRSKTMNFARKNMEIVNEINDKNTSLKLLTEPTLLGQPFVPRSARHHTSLNIRKTWEHKKAPQMLHAKIDEIELQASFEVATKIRDYVLLEAKYLWEEKAPKFALALLELVSYVSDTLHANIPSVERWMNVNETERRMYSLIHLAKELSQNQPDFFPEYMGCSYQDFCQGFALSQNFGNKMQNVTRSYTSALNGNTRAVQHISAVNHWLRYVVYHVSVEYTAFTKGRERIKKN
jgi:hypothetical protein